MRFYRFFERLLPAYPEAEPTLPPQGFMAFLWACTHGTRRYIGVMAVLSGLLAAFEALLFAFLGRIIDWLGQPELAATPARLFTEHDTALWLLGALVVGGLVFGPKVWVLCEKL